MQSVLFDELKKRRDQGVCIFISSHNLKEIQEHCDRVAFIRKGETIEVGQLDDRVKEGMYVRVKGEIKSLQPLAQSIFMERDNEISFIYNGDMNLLIQKLSTLSIENLIVENFSIEHQLVL